MNRVLLTFVIYLISLNICVHAQNNECRQKTKRFPSAFTHMTSDYANMNIQADVLPKHFFQIESSLSFGALFKNAEGEKYYGYNANLLRVGMGTNFELRGVFAIPGKNIQLNYPEIENLHVPFTIGAKVNLLPESSSTPGVSFEVDYVYYDKTSHFQPALILDKFAFKVLKLSMSAGPQFALKGTSSKLAYSVGIIMKERNSNIGIYSLASNRYNYLENIFHMGLVFSDNLNYHFTCGYGVHQDHGLFMVSYSGLFNNKTLQSKFGGYF